MVAVRCAAVHSLQGSLLPACAAAAGANLLLCCLAQLVCHNHNKGSSPLFSRDV